MTDPNALRSSTATCWFCDTYPSHGPAAMKVELVKTGEEGRAVEVPRCQVCANNHQAWMVFGGGLGIGAIIALILWFVQSGTAALIAFGVILVLAAVADILNQKLRFQEEKTKITTRPDTDAVEYAPIQALREEGWQLPKEAKKELNDFYRAIKRFEPEAVAGFLDKDPKLIGVVDKDSSTPLQYAVSLEPMVGAMYSDNPDRLAVIKVLAARGADFGVRDKGGRNLLHEACRNLFVEAIELLVQKGLDINARDDMEMTPLHYAVWWGGAGPRPEDRPLVVEMLVARGANIDAIDESRESLLMKTIPSAQASWQPYTYETVKILLGLGADPRGRSKLRGKKTAYELLLDCDKKEPQFRDTLALFEGGRRIGICEVCGRLIFEGEPFFENREFGHESVSSGALHYDVGRGLYHRDCAQGA